MVNQASSRVINSVTIRNHYNLMRKSFESAVQGGACDMSRNEINACYEWRISNMLIKDTVEVESSFSYEEWDAFVRSCDLRAGLSSSRLKKVNTGIERVYRDIMAQSNNMWRSDNERIRLTDAIGRLNRFLTVDMYSENTVSERSFSSCPRKDGV